MGGEVKGKERRGPAWIFCPGALKFLVTPLSVNRLITVLSVASSCFLRTCLKQFSTNITTSARFNVHSCHSKPDDYRQSGLRLGLYRTEPNIKVLVVVSVQSARTVASLPNLHVRLLVTRDQQVAWSRGLLLSLRR